MADAQAETTRRLTIFAPRFRSRSFLVSIRLARSSNPQ
jgi:hypothetical protein